MRALNQQLNFDGMEDPTIDQYEVTMAALVEAYLLEHLVRPVTAHTYRQSARRWVEETGITAIEAITREAVIAWRTEILSRARPETWNRYRRHLRALVNYAVARGWCSENAFKEVPPARTEYRLKKTVDADVLSRAFALLERCDEQQDKLKPAWFWAMVIRTYYFTGVRRRQFVAMNWHDVDLVHGTLRIRAETSKTHREWTLPLAEPVIRDLEGLYQRTEQRLGRPPSPKEQVFNVTLFYARYFGTRMTDDQLAGFFQRLSAALGAKITPHRLRHTMATLLAAYGDIRTLQEILGHTNVSTTMGYVHPDIERMRSLVSKLPLL